ncbi:protein of unknown function [Allopseudospirillum japonicum]|uniref:DUF349 domain-containing protein n=1 Tax=Allopseudospirillum japonicum TaxID=64971 RepID=A0A1H6REJ3_9GAMM|nr:DUF349 domain-containing protein [Allopseudospirillum japonicum]SEI52876.1 protein of unknown function [Allopseudospirillum japonicum]
MPFFSKFLNLFNKSNVQHPNQRLEAVHQLHPQTPEGRQALEQLILTETQTPLLQAAILQLNDLAWVFDQCANAAQPQAVQHAALPILCGQAPHSEKLPLPKLEQRLQLLEHPQCQHAWLLQKVVQEADNLELRLQALARLSAQQTPELEAEILAPIALENTIAQVRLQAAQGIHSEAVLEQLVRLSVRDKGVLRLAKERLADYKADATARAQALQQRQQLLDKICTHARTSYTPLFAAKFRHLVKEWQQLEAPCDETTEARYQEARLVCEKTIADQEAREHAERQAVENQARVQQQQAQVVQSLQEIHAHLDQYFDLSATGLASLQSQLEWQQKHWQNLQQEAAPKPDTLNAYQAISQELAQATLALEALKQVQSQLAPLLTQDESMEARSQAAHLDKLLTEIPAWPANLERPPLLEQAYAYLKQAHHQAYPPADGPEASTPSALENQLACLLEECRQRLDAGETQAGIQTYSHAQDLWQQLGSTQAAQLAHTSLEQTYKALHVRISELKDWQGFVAQPKREQLCQRMEALVDDQMEPQLKAERIQALQQEWKQLGNVGVHKALWTRFKQAADQAYAPCQAYFAEEAKVREYHRQ